MRQLIVKSHHVGDILVSEELLELLGSATIDTAVGHLRLGGGRCWRCRATIHPVEDVCLIVHRTAAGGTIGFVHRRCGPPQVIDRRRNRRAAIVQNRYLAECVTDVQAFAVTRNYPSPHAMLVVSPSTPMAATADNGEAMNPWLDLAFEARFVPVAPTVLDAAPEVIEGWSLHVDGFDTVICDSPRGPLYDGQLETPLPWLEALASERHCVVLMAGLGVDSDALGPGCGPALDLLASRGLIAAATVQTTSMLGLHTALAMKARRVPATNASSIINSPGH